VDKKVKASGNKAAKSACAMPKKKSAAKAGGASPDKKAKKGQYK
jgi:hypothetical protein